MCFTIQSFLRTSPVRVRTFELGMVLAMSVTVLCCMPDFPALLNVTSMTLSFPGAIASFGHLGTVQPQLPVAELITRSDFPVFLNLKAYEMLSPSLRLPKS